MLNASSLLFENLMKYNDATQAKRNLKENVKPVKEEDETIVNLQVELPQDLEDVKPDDIKVDVGVMPVETEDEDNSKVKDDESIEDEIPEENDSIDVEEDDVDNEADKKESLKRKRLEAFRKMKEAKDCKDDEDEKPLEETNDLETAKKNILARTQKTEGTKSDVDDECTGKDDCQCKACKDKKPEEKKESLARLDTTSLNHLITTFVKDNYKNIDKITISKAILENNQLILKGTITNLDGKSESIKLVNKGFNVKKLEGKKFVMDFADASNTFGIVNESVKKPFIFIASLKEGILKFNSLKYNFKTKITEGKIAKVYGTCNLLKESKTRKYNRSTFLKEAELRTMTGTDLLNYQGANNFDDGTKPFIAEGKGGTLIIAGSDENDGSALISIYYGPDGDRWAWKSYDDKETALKDAKLLVNIVNDEEVDVNQLKRFGFELM